MAYDYQIRPGLTQSGYSDSDISYDPNRKAVTLKGKDFITGDKLMNVAGSTFTDRGSFDTALKGYQQQEQADQAAIQNKQKIDALTNQVTNTQAPANPYTAQLDQQIKYLMDFAKTQPNVDPYSTPQYAAYQAQSGRRANEGIRASQEALGSAGFGRSTTLGQSAQGIQNQETEYLETQIIPQLLAAEEAKRQQQFSNLQSLLNPVQGQQAFMANQAQTERGNARDALSMLLGEDQRGIDNTRNSQLDALNQKNTEFNQGITAAGQTGYYNPSDMNADQINQEIAANSAAYNDATPEERQQLHARNVELNGLLGKTDSTGSGDYVGGNENGKVGYRTLEGQQIDTNKAVDQRNFDYTKGVDERNFDYQKAKDDIATGQWDKSFELELEKWADAKNLNWAQFDQSTKQALAQIAISQQNANTSSASQATAASNSAYDKDPNNPDNRYKEAQINALSTEKPPSESESNNQFTATVVGNVDKMTPDMKKTFFTNERANLIAKLGQAGYEKLIGLYFDEYGEPK